MAAAVAGGAAPSAPPSAPAARADRYLVPGLARGLEVLALFDGTRPALTPAEIAASLGVTRSAVFRVLYTLTELGFLAAGPGGRRYAPGPALLRLGAALPGRGLVAAATPALAALRDATGWSAHLGRLEGREVAYLLRLPARPGQRGLVRVGTRLPAHATAMGRALLAALPEPRLAALYEGAPGGVAPGAVLKRARADRARGHVLHLGEFEAGIASIAVALPGPGEGGMPAALNLTTRLDAAEAARRGAALGAALRTAEGLARALARGG